MPTCSRCVALAQHQDPHTLPKTSWHGCLCQPEEQRELWCWDSGLGSSSGAGGKSCWREGAHLPRGAERVPGGDAVDAVVSVPRGLL